MDVRTHKYVWDSRFFLTFGPVVPLKANSKEWVLAGGDDGSISAPHVSLAFGPGIDQPDPRNDGSQLCGTRISLQTQAMITWMILVLLGKPADRADATLRASVSWRLCSVLLESCGSYGCGP